ncbi:MAG: glycosyltransferase family 8 protein [Treponema sp.]|nr:glycosyltransferase family 8 protein [Treponema sp.]
MIHIAFCINTNYVMPLGVLMISLLHFNKAEITFHIVSKDIGEHDLFLLEKNIEHYNNAKIIFHRITPEHDHKFIIRNDDHLSVETYYRFFLPELLSSNINKVLYLDADVICVDSIQQLFDTDLTGCAVGLCYDTNYNEIQKFNRLEYDYKYGYYNAGVMLINLDYWRKKQLANTLIDFVVHNPEKCLCHDQDAINAICHKSLKILPLRYNCQTAFFRLYAWENRKEYPKQLAYSDTIECNKWHEVKEAIERPCLIHFTARIKPWHKESHAPFGSVWRKFYSKSLWKDRRLKSKYSKLKFLKVSVHNLLAKMHIMPPVGIDIYPEEWKLTEKCYLNKIP